MKEQEEQRRLKDQEDQRLLEEAIAKANSEREELARKAALESAANKGVLIPVSPQANLSTTSPTLTQDGKNQEGSIQDHNGNGTTPSKGVSFTS